MIRRVLVVGALVLAVAPTASAQVAAEQTTTAGMHSNAALPLTGRTILVDPGHNGGNSSHH